MVVKPHTPLLPVHSMRDAKKRSRRKGTCMRLVIMAAVLFGIGYAVFATRHIGTSKDRRTARDNLIRSQLESSRLANSVSGGPHHDGRTLKEEHYSPRINVREHTPHRHVQRPQPRRHLEVSPESLTDTDEALYDAVVANDGGDRHDFRSRQQRASIHQHYQQQQQQQYAKQQPQAKPITYEAGREDHVISAPHVAPQDHRDEQLKKQQEQHELYQLQQEQNKKQEQHELYQIQQQQQQQQQHHTAASPVVAGPGEIDREAEAKRAASVTAPSLAVGSRIEADSHASDHRAVVEPGASPVVTAPKEPSVQQPVQQPAPIPVSHLEPDSHQAQRVPEVHAPVITQAPHETDSSSQPVVQHRAPEDVPAVAKPVEVTSTGATTTAAPVVPAPVVQQPVTAPHLDSTSVKSPWATGLYALEAKDIDGRVRSLSEFAGKVTIVVNVASACGYTDENYKGLMKTYEKYHAHGLEVLGFPCNQFANQESGTEAEIKSFCSAHYKVNFPMFSKVDVNGPNTHPVYQFLKRELPETEGGGGGKGPGQDLVWNFQKIIVNHEGRPVKRVYQAWEQGTVENEVYQLLHDARRAGALPGAASQ